MGKVSNIYLVDCENVGCKKLSNLTDSDLVIYFTSNSQFVLNLNKNEREEHSFHDNTKNALDFIINTKLGYLICHYGKSVHYNIVSNDKGFDLVASYWKCHGYFVERLEDKKEVDLNNNYIYNSLSDKEKRKLKNVYESWARSKAKDYNVLYDQLRRSFRDILFGNDLKLLCNDIYNKGVI